MGFSGIKRLGVDPSKRSSTIEHKLGERIIDDEGRVLVYILANGAIGAGVPVKLAAGFDCPPAGSGGAVFGVAEVAFADNEYGWVIVQGKVVDAQVETGTSAGAALIRDADANGDLEAVTAATDAQVGVALEAESGGVADVYLF